MFSAANWLREIELLKRTIRAGQLEHTSYSVRMPTGNLTVATHEQVSCLVATACFGTEHGDRVFRR